MPTLEVAGRPGHHGLGVACLDVGEEPLRGRTAEHGYLPWTLETLESLAVPGIGYRTDEFPAFWCRSSGVAVPHRVELPAEVAGAVRAARALGQTTGFLVAVPCPEAEALPRELVEPAIEQALAEADRAGIAGGAVTPFVLDRLAEMTGGRTLPANLALAEQNAEVAAEIAGELHRT